MCSAICCGARPFGERSRQRAGLGPPAPSRTSCDLCLKAIPPAEMPATATRRRPSQALMRLTVAPETYHKLKGRCSEAAPRRRPFLAGDIVSAARSAAIKFRGL